MDVFHNRKNLDLEQPFGVLKISARCSSGRTMPKRSNPMAVSKALTYTVEEAATTLGVTTATIRNYVKRGLPIMTAQRPYLISGEAMREFLLNEREGRLAGTSEALASSRSIQAARCVC